MLQTDRKAETARQTPQDQTRSERKQALEPKSAAALALEAILSGGSWEQLPPEGMLRLSHTVGNDALLSLIALREAGQETEVFSLPQSPCLTAPAALGGSELPQAAAPDFGAMAPLGEAAPLAL